MSIASFGFLLFVILALVLYSFIANDRRREIVLLLISISFVASFSRTLIDLAPIAAFVGLGYAALFVIERNRGGKVLAASLILLLGIFIYLKQYELIDFLPTPGFSYLTVGMSYILFRILHLCIDTREGDFRGQIPLISYLNYAFFFPAFVSGPIQRYQDFSEQFARNTMSEHTVDSTLRAFARITGGYFKTVVAGAIFLMLHQETHHLFDAASAPSTSGILYAASAALYFLFLYMNFSGYTDIVVGISNLFGFTLPENFNRPLSANNILNFWSRWHITLSEWFRIYLFNGIIKTLMHRWPSTTLAPYFACGAFFVTFLAMGMWHGTTIIFLWLALYFGAGVSINKLYQVLMTRFLGRKGYLQLCANRFYIVVCRGLTFSYFSFAMTSLWVDAQGFIDLSSKLGVGGWIAAIFILLIISGPALVSIDALIDRAKASRLTGLYVSNRPIQYVYLAIVALVVVSTGFITASAAPEFVYKGF
jgi:alginate O-acetyltransferase complex protein AlgI